MKRTILLTLAALMLSALMSTACTMSGEITPTLAPMRSATPAPGATATQKPSAMPSASAAPSASPQTTGAIIDGFVEGTVCDPEDVPQIVKAVESKYPGAEIRSITQTMYMSAQVYEVIFADADGNTHTVYVSPDGSSVKDAAMPSASPMATD